MNSRLIKALKRQAVDTTPIWIMRQAGRYLPEYRAIRHRVGGFLKMCKNPEIASKITLQPLERFDLDAGIIFSDILTIPDAMGLGLHFKENEGPLFASPIREKKSIDQLSIPCPEEDLKYVMDAIRLVKQHCQVPLIGFCGSPWTVATYMVEGKSSRHFSMIKTMMYNEPELLKQLLSKITQASSLYLKAQIEAGADVVMIFDTWGGVLTPRTYHAFSYFFMKEIVYFLKTHPNTKEIPIILFTKQGGQWLESLANTGCDCIGIDWTVDIAQAKKRVGHQVSLQGNLDVSNLYADESKIRESVRVVLRDFGEGPGHIFNLGHGIYPDIDVEKVKVMIDAVREYGRKNEEN